MKKNDVAVLFGIAVIAATLAYIVSSSLFKYSAQANSVPVVETVNPVLPDAYNDPSYTAIFNSNAIDPTQLTHIGNQNNSNPFGGTTQ